MKTYIKIILVVVATMFTISCNDDFLDRKPLDKISNETFWNTENDLRVYNNGIYHLARFEDNVPILMGHDEGFDSQARGIWHLDGFSDNTAPRHARHDFFQRVRAGKHAIPENPDWFGYEGWNFLRAINIGLENYPKVDVSDAIRNQYAGEARLLRGWFYADKVSKYGNVQWVDREVNIDDDDILYGERDDREFVMEKVLEDLNFATENIPNDWKDGNAPGRLNRWCALLVKSQSLSIRGHLAQIPWRQQPGNVAAAGSRCIARINRRRSVFNLFNG